jgi:DNA-binding CsgD family transcriptional regulator/tetratricopeptide (TPR) repeat protein
MELVERDGCLAILQTTFSKVTEGEGHCVFVSGEAGIGKTALVKAFCKQQQNDCTIYQGACDSLFTPRPLAPLYDIIWQVRSDLWPASHTIEERSALFLKFFHELSNRDKKILIVFEDIHWADEATLDFIKFFSRRIAQLPCLFILTYRDDEIHSRHPLRNVLGDLSPDTSTRIQLTALSREAVYKMANEKGYDAENVYSISGGNPFYVNEILASYSPGVPENIKDSILSVYDRQEEGTKNAWQICSVIPEGIEINRFAKIKSSWDDGMDHCFALKIIIIKNDRVIFKHELYRRTIEASLSPFKRIAINKKILELFLTSFEEEGEIERIVHYAKNANENKLVVKYAPLAARQAAGVGAHIEASKLFLTAIEYAEENDEDQLVEFYEAYAYECYLINQLKEAILYQEKALKIWQQKNKPEQTGNSLRLLSRFWWFSGNSEEAEKYGKEATQILQGLPSSKAKAMALSNMSQLKMFSEEVPESVKWGNMAIKMAREIKDDEILCHALNNVGTCQWKIQSTRETGRKLLMESLDIALKNSFHEHAGRAYSNIIYNCVEAKEYDLTKRFLHDGLTYGEERDLDASNNFKLSLKSRMLLETGDWNGALSVANDLLQDPEQPATIKTGCLVTLATIKIRRGEPDALIPLEEAKVLAFKTKEYRRIIPVMIALLEYEWLTGEKIISEEELKLCFSLIQKVDNIYLNSEICFWLQKAGKRGTGLPELFEPYQLLREGNISGAADFWQKTGCPFEKAFALFEGNEEDKKNALLIFQQLGANAVAEKIKMQLRAGGIKKIPRGLRESTRANPAQLTNRELDVLQLLQKGNQNKEIAGTLFISPKTADHHISSILFKLDVKNRSKAVAEAVRLGILK